MLQVISEATMLHVVLWTYMLRMGLYALLPYAGSPWAVLPVELLHGITFACGWGAGEAPGPGVRRVTCRQCSAQARSAEAHLS